MTIAQKIINNVPLDEREQMAVEFDSECPDHALAIMDYWDEH